MNKEEAIKEAVESNEQYDVFCPIIKEKCNPKCVCHRPAYARHWGNRDGFWASTPPYCSNITLTTKADWDK